MSSDVAEAKLRARRCSCKAFVLLAVSCAVCLCLFLEHQRHDALTWGHQRHGEVRGPRFLKKSSFSSTAREAGPRVGVSGAAAATAATAISAASTIALSAEGEGELERLRSELEVARAQAASANAELQELRKQSSSQGGSAGDPRLGTTPSGITAVAFAAATGEEASTSTDLTNSFPIEDSKTNSTLTPAEDDKEDVLPIPESLWRRPPEDPEAETENNSEDGDAVPQLKVPSTTELPVGQPEVPALSSQVAQDPEIIVKAGGSEIRLQVGQSKDDTVLPVMPTLIPTSRSSPSEHESPDSANEVDGDDHQNSFVAGAQALEPAPAPPLQPEISVKAGGQEIIVTINSDSGSPSVPPSPPPHQPGTTQPILLSQFNSQAESVVSEAADQQLQLTAANVRGSDTSEVQAMAGQPAEMKGEGPFPALAIKPDVAADHSKAGQGGTQITVKSGGQSITIEVVTGSDESVASSALQPTPAASNQVEATEASGRPLLPLVSSSEEEQEPTSPTLQEENGQPSWLNAPLSGLSDEEQQADNPRIEEGTPVVALAPSDSGEAALVSDDITSPVAPAEPVPGPSFFDVTTTTVPTDEYANLALRAR